MLPRTALELVIDPALAWLEMGAGIEGDDRARRLLLAVALQESGCIHRRQINGGPASGLWQFEKTGGVWGVLTHPATERTAEVVCARFQVSDTPEGVHKALAECDALAACFARLLLWTDTQSLPLTESQAWDCYLRLWRPGRPRPQHWSAHWRAAVGAVRDLPIQQMVEIGQRPLTET